MITRNDVAKLACVSGATVTRVFNNFPNVREDTRARVLAAAKELNYHPNYSGRILRGQSTHQILFYCPDLYNPFYVHVYYGMDDYARKNNYSIVLTRHFDKETILQGQFDGIVLSVNDHHRMEHIRFLQGESIPFICALFSPVSDDLHSVGFNFNQAASIAMANLYANGHRSIVYVSENSSLEDAKWLGLQHYIKEHDDICLDRLYLHPSPEENDNIYEVGYLYAARIYRLIKLPTAIVASNDAVATGLIRGLHECGVRLPEDISIISFDDTYMSRFTVPSLTTVHFPKYEMGQELIRGLLSILDNKEFESVSLNSRLIVRESTSSAKIQS